MEGNTPPRPCGGLVQRAAAALSVRRRPLGALCAVALAAGCGGRGLAPAPAPSEVRLTRECRVETYPARLPAPEALVDTAALSPGLRALRDSARLPGGEVLLTLWYQPDGVNVRRDVMRHSVTPTVADSVQELVFAALRRAPEMPAPWGTRLRVDMGGGVGYEVARREHCPPRPRSNTLESAMAEYQGTGVGYRAGVRVRTVLMHVTVHPSGFVEDARILRGAPAGGTLERQLRDQLRQYSFYPAVLDGLPVRGVIAVPLRIRA